MIVYCIEIKEAYKTSKDNQEDPKRKDEYIKKAVDCCAQYGKSEGLAKETKASRSDSDDMSIRSGSGHRTRSESKKRMRLDQQKP